MVQLIIIVILKMGAQVRTGKQNFTKIVGATPTAIEPQKIERKRINIVIQVYRPLFLARALLSVFTIFLLM